MKARIAAEMIVGRGLVLQSGEVVDLAVFGEYAEFLLHESAIELVEPILAVVETQKVDSTATLI